MSRVFFAMAIFVHVWHESSCISTTGKKGPKKLPLRQLCLMSYASDVARYSDS
jgi:hypothetical protein